MNDLNTRKFHIAPDFLQFRENEEAIRQLEFQLTESQAEVQHKNRQIQDMHENIADMKCQMNDVRDEKNKCENEVRNPEYSPINCWRVVTPKRLKRIKETIFTK